MHPVSASDDFVTTTLEGVPGALAKLVYLSGLRDESGEIQHWGLEKIHGRERAREALKSAYYKLMREFLAMPLPEIWHEVEEYCRENGRREDDYMQELRDIVPIRERTQFSDAQFGHFNLILDELSALAEAAQAGPRSTA